MHCCQILTMNQWLDQVLQVGTLQVGKRTRQSQCQMTTKVLALLMVYHPAMWLISLQHLTPRSLRVTLHQKAVKLLFQFGSVTSLSRQAHP